MNWFVHGTTDKCIGFLQDGGVCEGGNCEHLKPGDQAYGHSSECDSFGSEMYLYCEACYKAFVEARKVELIHCDDCGSEVPRNETISHVPYYVDEYPREKWRKVVCKPCQTQPRHLRRLEVDEEEKSHDQDAQDDWFDQHGPDDVPDDDEPDDLEDGMPDLQVEYTMGKHTNVVVPLHLPLVVFDRKTVPKDWPNLYSSTIQKIVVSVRLTREDGMVLGKDFGKQFGLCAHLFH